MPHTPHPFARFIAILGRGRNLSRALTLEEAEEAMTMILEDNVLPEQLGAFLMLLRVKEESPAEIAGFVQAVRKSLPPPPDAPPAVDWSSYAGKKRQLPWFLLAALCLAQSGRRLHAWLRRPHRRAGSIPATSCARWACRRPKISPPRRSSSKQKNFAYMDLDRASARRWRG